MHHPTVHTQAVAHEIRESETVQYIQLRGEHTILVSLPESGFDEDSPTDAAAAGTSDFTFCFYEPTIKNDRPTRIHHQSQTVSIRGIQ